MSDMDLYVEFGRKVAAARRDLRLTQAELAARVSLTRASVANIETGRQRVMLHDVYAIVEALDGRSILDFVPERIQKVVPEDVVFSGAEVSETEERLMMKMIEMATAGARPRRSK